jgi:hypothetical protein
MEVVSIPDECCLFVSVPDEGCLGVSDQMNVVWL